MKRKDVPVGQRILYTENPWGREYPKEATVVEWSDGDRVKLKNELGNTFWLSESDTDQLTVLEHLD